jgi:hypothetical protein
MGANQYGYTRYDDDDETIKTTTATTKPDYDVLAQASHPFPATRVTWEPRPSGSRLTGRGQYERDVELIATTGDALRVWEVERSDWGVGGELEEDEEGDEFGRASERQQQVGRVGWGGRRESSKVRLRERSKLTNVSTPWVLMIVARLAWQLFSLTPCSSV